MVYILHNFSFKWKKNAEEMFPQISMFPKSHHILGSPPQKKSSPVVQDGGCVCLDRRRFGARSQCLGASRGHRKIAEVVALGKWSPEIGMEKWMKRKYIYIHTHICIPWDSKRPLKEWVDLYNHHCLPSDVHHRNWVNHYFNGGGSPVFDV